MEPPLNTRLKTFNYTPIKSNKQELFNSIKNQYRSKLIFRTFAFF